MCCVLEVQCNKTVNLDFLHGYTVDTVSTSEAKVGHLNAVSPSASLGLREVKFL